MRKWQPTHNLNWAVLLNRAEVRKHIITIRSLRAGTITGDEAYWRRRLVEDWSFYRLFMAEREVERRDWKDTQRALRMSKAVFDPMMETVE